MSGQESIFTRDGDLFIPTDHASGPWDPQALHGGAPAALITSAFEQMQPASDLRLGRLSFQLLRPIPSQPLQLSTEVVRPGRRVVELGAQLFCADQLVCRAKALMVQPVPPSLPARADPGEPAANVEPMPGPETGQPVVFALDDTTRRSFATTAIEMSWLTKPWTLGPAKVWMRLKVPILPDRPASPLSLLAGCSDFGNGIAAELRFDQYLFINADLTVHLSRHPTGDWIGLDSRTILQPNGSGLSESILHDIHGPVASAFQTLVVQPR